MEKLENYICSKYAIVRDILMKYLRNKSPILSAAIMTIKAMIICMFNEAENIALTFDWLFFS